MNPFWETLGEELSATDLMQNPEEGEIVTRIMEKKQFNSILI